MAIFQVGGTIIKVRAEREVDSLYHGIVSDSGLCFPEQNAEFELGELVSEPSRKWSITSVTFGVQDRG